MSWHAKAMLGSGAAVLLSVLSELLAFAVIEESLRASLFFAVASDGWLAVAAFLVALAFYLILRDRSAAPN